MIAPPEEPTPGLAFGPAVRAPALPLNFMPAALASLRGEAGARAVVDLGAAAEAVRFEAWRPSDLLDAPAAARGAGPFLLGPNVQGREPSGPDRPHATAHAITHALAPGGDEKGSGGGSPQAALVVIDHGIAFWNHRFRDGSNNPRFREIRVLDLDAHPGRAASLHMDRLGAEAIADLCRTADAPDGARRVRRALAERFPGGFFGAGPEGDGFWHGTAMADVAAGGDPADPGEGAWPAPELFAVELPAAAVRDSGGDTLVALLPAALAAALDMAAGIDAPSVTILLAFGFPAGPQDGSHPAAAAIADLLKRSRRPVRLIVPAGNHRQDRGCARLRARGADGTQDAPWVDWRLQPDDFSPNTVEICLPADAEWSLSLTLPGGAGAPGGETRVSPRPGQFLPLYHDGALIGGLHALPVPTEVARLRLSLAPTARRRGAAPAPAGVWRIELSATRDARLWIQRDDWLPADRATPHRLSTFEDHRWRDRDAVGTWRLEDDEDAVVCRAGSLSVLATARGVEPVGALEKRGSEEVTAPYSGRPLPPDLSAKGETPAPLDVDGHWARVVDHRAGRGVLAVGNGGRRLFRISGTSVAAALAARDACWEGAKPPETAAV